MELNRQIQRLLQTYPDLVECQDAIMDAFQALKEMFENKGKLLLAGNGGSASDCEHIVGELMKGFVLKRALPQSEKNKLAEAGDDGGYIGHHLQGALPAISLVGHTSLMTAFANDVAPDLVFAQQVYGYGKAGDAFLGISTSGNSKNIVQAATVANSQGMTTICLTGKGGGALKEIADITIDVPYQETFMVQERHLPIYHSLCLMLEEAFFA
ncbi:D-sedoheptulose 7-phosphate isomerase [Scopulibacillus darangshiensis]|uniref:D-sedoheptulose 7-phosphate isomerase n=1 Tax=Scopulibacillus darangshiensis TaxID=442528 RepID=A0A4V2SN28_9BACL|nr:SIS domain-containing protein [Scopulibacillus darangshiensis]TCP29456.1 D-sedoheptulose 7-phosphate isomerase [Scopulibacillus darangshiensis]